MKITCQACAAKYTIADEKVSGKIVKIRCKKCSATIVINGTGDGVAAELGSADQAKPIFSQGESWTVNVGDGDQRTMSAREVAAAYRAGTVDDETFCWKEGMPDWLPLRDVPALSSARAALGVSGADAAHKDATEEDDATRIQNAPPLALGPSAADASSRSIPHGGNGSAPPHFPIGPGAAAARRAGGRLAPAADLFGGAAQAGGEDDVMTSAPLGMPRPHNDDPQKRTGERNENSVLFSINALTSKGGVVAPQPMTATSEASGLIDIRQLSAQMGIGDSKKSSRIDDIMNLAGGGGAFAPSLSAPMLLAPSTEALGPPSAASSMPPARGKEVLFLGLGAGVFVLVATIGVAVLVGRRGSEENGQAKAGTSASAGAAEARSTESAASNELPTSSAAPSEMQTRPAEATPAAKTSPPNPATNATKDTPQKVAAGAPNSVHKETQPSPAAFVAAAAPEVPFNMGEAKARLAAIAASVQPCKRGDVTGTGRVVVVFAPSGAAQSASVSGPPFEGTPTGACVAAHFRGAHVPAFGGSAFSVSKSFTIN